MPLVTVEQPVHFAAASDGGWPSFIHHPPADAGTPFLYGLLEPAGDVIVAAGTSGHGFKFAPELGHLVLRLVEGDPPHPRFATGGHDPPR